IPASHHNCGKYYPNLRDIKGNDGHQVDVIYLKEVLQSGEVASHYTIAVDMYTAIKGVYENGVLRLLEPVSGIKKCAIKRINYYRRTGLISLFPA
uniref:antitoxin family protein n=1 Tax=Parapedobacter tibetensis TaxID=2972951 RepID=UPI002153A3C2